MSTVKIPHVKFRKRVKVDEQTKKLLTEKHASFTMFHTQEEMAEELGIHGNTLANVLKNGYCNTITLQKLQQNLPRL